MDSLNLRRVFDASGQDKNIPFIANSMMTEMLTLGQENVFCCTMRSILKQSDCVYMHIQELGMYLNIQVLTIKILGICITC